MRHEEVSSQELTVEENSVRVCVEGGGRVSAATQTRFLPLPEERVTYSKVPQPPSEDKMAAGAAG